MAAASNATSVVIKCVLEGSHDVLRLRVPGALQWSTLQAALSHGLGPSADFSKFLYEDDEGDWCTLTDATFEDFAAIKANEPVVKLRVRSDGGDCHLPVPDGTAPCPANACGPKPLLTALQQLSHGCEGGWTAENVCTVILSFLPTFEQRALRKVEKLNKMGPVLVGQFKEALDKLLVCLEKQPMKPDLCEQLRDILGGHRMRELGNFAFNFAHALQALPFPERKRLFLPVLKILLRMRPGIFQEMFGDTKDDASGAHPRPETSAVELPSGRRVPITSIVDPQEHLSLPLAVHITCLGGVSVPHKAWANLRISEEGKVGIGGSGKYASFTMYPKGFDADGLQKVVLESSGGGGFLRYDGLGSFNGGLPCAEASFLLKPLGVRGAGDQKAPVFALLSEVAGCAVGMRSSGVFSIPKNELQEDTSTGAFIIVRMLKATSLTDDGTKQQPNSNQIDQQNAEKTDTQQVEKAALQEAKRLAKLQEKTEKEAKKATEQEKKQLAKLAKHADKEAKKSAGHAEKRQLKEAEREAKQLAAQQLAAQQWAAQQLVQVRALSELQDGALLIVESTAAGPGRLRILKDGSVDVKGGFGTWTHFVVRLQEPSNVSTPIGTLRLALQSKPSPTRHLRLPGGVPFAFKNLVGDGTGIQQEGCVFELAAEDADGEHGRFKFHTVANESVDSSCTVQLYRSQCVKHGDVEIDNTTDSGLDNEWMLAALEEKVVGEGL